MGGNASTWRTELITRVPWVNRLDPPEKCDQYRWSAMPMKAVHNPMLKEKYCCKVGARWRFTGLDTKTPLDDFITGVLIGKSGVYCYSHLINQAFIPEREWKRWQAWCDENRELIERIKTGQEPKLIKRVRSRAHHEVSDEA